MRSWNSLAEDSGVIKSTSGFKDNPTRGCEMPMKRLQARFGSGKPQTSSCLKAKWCHWSLPSFLQYCLKTHSQLRRLWSDLLWFLNSKYLEEQAVKWRQDSHLPWQTKWVWILLFKFIWTNLHYPKLFIAYKIPFLSKNRRKTLSKSKAHHKKYTNVPLPQLVPAAAKGAAACWNYPNLGCTFLFSLRGSF